jgi:hypothetical protein
MTVRRDRRAGFMLMEALVTLALSALVLAGASALVALLLRAADRTALAAESIEITGRAVAAIERDIRQAVRVRRPDERGPGMVFLGSPEELLLVMDRPAANGLMRPVVVRWRSEKGGTGRGRLVRSEAPLPPGTARPDPDSGRRNLVDTGSAVIRFAYFGPQPDGAGEVLTDVWPSTDSLPNAVRIGQADPATMAVRSSVRIQFRTDAEIGCASPVLCYCSLTPGRPAGSVAEGGSSQVNHQNSDGAAPDANGPDQ